MIPPTPTAEPIPENLLREPLEYLFADHVRLKAFCGVVGEIAIEMESETQDIGGMTGPVDAVLDYLKDELPHHIADEEMDVLPLLSLRCRPEDRFDAMLAKIGREHAEEEVLTETLVAELGRIAQGMRPKDPRTLTDVAKKFAEAHCRHLQWENETLLPLARKRLTREDQRRIGRTMAKRRGISYPD